ncbi:MAG: hypothetical protein SFV23_24005 [Planctomycetaceae bacterium]|nr:hypothetical protein [Planctomycetaceae bacterium]
MAHPDRSHIAIHLFPFIDVLVCVMGSLILMLVVTTTKLRSAAIARAIAATQAAVDEPIMPEFAEEPAPAPSTLPSDVEATPIVTTPSAPEADPALLHAEREAQKEALRREWGNKVASLEQTLDERSGAFRRQQLLAQSTERALAALRQEILQHETELAVMMGRLSATQDAVPEAARERVRLEQRILALREQLKQVETEQRTAGSRYSIVPFEGKSGTTRHPILIECRSTGLRFLPEDVTLTPSDISGFTPGFNPLLAGSLALIDYWGRQAQDADSQPYVLLVVRPDGTLAYYIAMQLLSKLKQPHGYELITDDVELQLPAVDLDAKSALEAAIQRVLAEREQVANALQSGSRGGVGRGGSVGSNGEVAGFGAAQDGINGAGLSAGRVGAGARGPTNGLPGSSRSTEWSSNGTRRNVGAPPARSAGDSQSDVVAGPPSSGKEFSLSDLEGPVEPNTRKLNDVEAFEGQEYRRQRSQGGEASSSGSGPVSGSKSLPPQRLQPEAVEHPGNRVAKDADGPASGSSRGPRREDPLADEEAPRYPTFAQEAPPRGSRGPKLPYEKLQRRKWGPHDPGASIGVEKPVEIRVDAERMIVGGTTVIRLRPDASRHEIFDQLLATLDQNSRGWEAPGPGFFWVPSLRFVISPGGNVMYERIAPLVTKSGLSNSREFTLEATSPVLQESRP